MNTPKQKDNITVDKLLSELEKLIKQGYGDCYIIVNDKNGNEYYPTYMRLFEKEEKDVIKFG